MSKNKSLFVGRKVELNRLDSIYKTPTPSLVVIKGRRRIGKSRLIHWFASKQNPHAFWHFSGLAPHGTMDAQSQRDNFAYQLAGHLNLPRFTFTDWSDAFVYLGQHLKPNDIVLFDEISWMGDKDPSFIPKLKAWWDTQTQSIMAFFCGSVSVWIEDNILNSTAFFGRVNLVITLESLSIADAYRLLTAYGFQGSDYDAYKLLSIVGGVPWYLEQIVPGQSADAFIKHLCFEKDGILVTEFDRIFHDLFNGKSSVYKKILHCLSDGMKSLAAIRTALEFPHSGTLSLIMNHLIVAGFVEKQQLWSFKTHKPLKQSLYRIADPYMRFYLKVICLHRHKIDAHAFRDSAISSLPGFDAHIGLQLEQLLLQNRDRLLDAIGISPADTVACGPFRQVQTKTRSGCQIDFLVQTKTNTLFICEFKFKRREIATDSIEQMTHKLNALDAPKGVAKVPVLFHISGVSDALAVAGYFYRIIDITDFLNANPHSAQMRKKF